MNTLKSAKKNRLPPSLRGYLLERTPTVERVIKCAACGSQGCELPLEFYFTTSQLTKFGHSNKFSTHQNELAAIYSLKTLNSYCLNVISGTIFYTTLNYYRQMRLYTIRTKSMGTYFTTWKILTQYLLPHLTLISFSSNTLSRIICMAITKDTLTYLHWDIKTNRLQVT